MAGAAIALALAGCGNAADDTADPVDNATPTQAADPAAAAVADEARPAEDKARDANRKPAEIVAFSGVKPGDIVAEVAPGGGYYTRILAKAVGPEGHVYALVPSIFANRPGGLDAINALAAAYPNVTVQAVDFGNFELDRPVDVVWTTENYHDIANGDIDAANRAFFSALKPGGIYFVEDHSAPGTGTSATSTLHRIDPQAVKDQVAAAGFSLEEESSALANPEDPHTASANDDSIKGRTDKFALRFRKPAE